MTHREKLLSYILPMVEKAILAAKFPFRQRRSHGKGGRK